MSNAKVIFVKINELFLDPNNYRLVNEKNYSEVKEEDFTKDLVQKRTINMICGPKNDNIRDLLDSLRVNGYLPVDQIQVRELSENKYLVLEGNRRVSALKTLKKEYEEDSLDLGAFDSDLFDKIPVVKYTGNADSIQHLIVMGLKHISGNKKWGEWNEALLMKKLADSGKKEDEICKAIGIDKAQFRRSLRAIALIDQYKESDYGDQFHDRMYPIFREIVYSVPIKDWLKWDENIFKACDNNHTEILFNLLSKDKYTIDDTIEYIEPAITKREEIRTLAKFIDDEKAVQVLIDERDISKAYNISKAGVQEQVLQPVNELVEKLSNTVTSISNVQLSNNNIEVIQKELFILQSVINKYEAKSSTNNRTDVFYTKIDKHLSDLHIISYKAYVDFKISNLNRLNIIAGDNNSGKSSLLEAIYILCHQTNYMGIYEVVRRRAKISDNRINQEWFVQQIPNNCKIQGTFDNKNVSFLSSLTIENRSDFDSTGYLETLSINSEFDNIDQSATIRFFSNKERVSLIDGQKIVCPIIYSSPFFLNEPHRYAEFYARAFQTKTLPTIISFIKENLIHSLRDIRLIDELQRFSVYDEDFQSVMDLSSYGEGLQRVFFISLLFASAENGILLLDEVENAIHVELLEDFVSLIETLSHRFNVQVFITSHSKECINSFAKNLNNSSEISYYSLFKDGNSIASKYYSGIDFLRLSTMANRDLRIVK